STQISTVSRAAIVLGFDAVRNICITAQLLSSLLESKNLSPSVYQRLIKLMAKAFQAAMLTRMMLSHYDDDIQEEAF
ncbi:HDOD domain-containing protein, partial [Zoogloea sp. LCSB751]